MDPHHLPWEDHTPFPDLRGTHWQREQQAIAGRLYSVCRLVYPGPDPLNVGLGWCIEGATTLHRNHRDQYGRVWETEDWVVRRADVTMTPLDRPGRDSDHKVHKRRR